MASGSAPPPTRTSGSGAQCCMLCYSPLYGAGLSIYHSRTFPQEKSLYAKLMEVTNYTASIPQLVSDMMCSICYTMLTQADQLDNQLNHVTAHIRALFHKMVQIQTEQVRHNRSAPGGPDTPGGPPRSVSNGTEQQQQQQHIMAAPNPKVEHQHRPPEQTAPTNLQMFKKSPKEDSQPQPAPRGSWLQSSSESGGDGPALQPTPATGQPEGEHGSDLFNIGAFLQTNLREPAGGGDGERAGRGAAASLTAPAAPVSSTGDFTDKFVQSTPSDDVYRFQCVLCQKLGDSEEAIRRHVRADHPGADRISFPAPAPAPKRARSSSGAAKSPKSPRPTISSTAPMMAQNIAARAFVCVSCDKAFGCEAFLTRHVEAQKCGQLFSCQFCGKEFTRSDKKARHERCHTGERPFSCEFCGKLFARRDKCTKHERTHTRCRPFECHSCGEVMSNRPEYTTHRRLCGERAAAAGRAASLAWAQPAATPAPAADS